MGALKIVSTNLTGDRNEEASANIEAAIMSALSESSLDALVKKHGVLLVKTAIQSVHSDLATDSTVETLIQQKKDRYIRTIFKNRLNELLSESTDEVMTEEKLVEICLDANKGKLASFHVRCITNMPEMYDQSFIASTSNLAIAKVLNSYRGATPEKKKKFNKRAYVSNLFLNSLKNSLKDYRGAQLAEKRGYGIEVLSGATGEKAEVNPKNPLLTNVTEKMEAELRRKMVLASLGELRNSASSERDQMMYAITEGRLLGLSSDDIGGLYSLHPSFVDDYEKSAGDLLKKTPELYEELREMLKDYEKEYDSSLTLASKDHITVDDVKKVTHADFPDRIFASSEEFVAHARELGKDAKTIGKMTNGLKNFKHFEPIFSWSAAGPLFKGKVKFVNNEQTAVVTLECICQESPELVKSTLKEVLAAYLGGGK